MQARIVKVTLTDNSKVWNVHTTVVDSDGKEKVLVIGALDHSCAMALHEAFEAAATFAQVGEDVL
jgi:hypothetical protein